MQFIIGNAPHNLHVTSVVLEPTENPDMLELFHCIRCGDKVIQYSGHVAMLVPGPTPVTLPVIARCKHCGHRYLFNSQL